ncbi:metallophosphoesterase family protein [Aestuariivivens sediminicola]|uniref:metallophosphoesterase family protein n=1 Tax=Aestuariivivens sediminicola TaxID=2913560 RepID=UPI001F57A611|nr:metallophosphoesterase [Aestuariivivens sediminicola]
MNRRTFIKSTSLAGVTLTLPNAIFSLDSTRKGVEFGLIADVHKDIMHDADYRLKAFIAAASKKDLDFILQLGDFCRPYDYNRSFLNIWNSYKGDRYHVLGNHDTDGGFTRDQTRAFWGMAENYYAFDKKGIHFIVLDGNDPNPKPWSGYNRYIGERQKQWLIDDLKRTTNPTIIFSHQTLELESDGVSNMKEIRQIIEDANKDAGYHKVMCCISGHTHTDFMTQINGVYYVQINSASYRWVGSKYKVIRYSKDIDKKYQWIKYTIPYKDPLYTFVKIKQDSIIIASKKTRFVGPGPKEMGLSQPGPHDPIVPTISNFKMKL